MVKELMILPCGWMMNVWEKLSWGLNLDLGADYRVQLDPVDPLTLTTLVPNFTVSPVSICGINQEHVH
jgi:hypothetical protein